MASIDNGYREDTRPFDGWVATHGLMLALSATGAFWIAVVTSLYFIL